MRCGSGDCFCTGRDLSELADRNAVEGLHPSRRWHRILNVLEFGRMPSVINPKYRALYFAITASPSARWCAGAPIKKIGLTAES